MRRDGWTGLPHVRFNYQFPKRTDDKIITVDNKKSNMSSFLLSLLP